MNYGNNLTNITGIRDELSYIATDVLALGALTSTYMKHNDDVLTSEEEDRAVSEFLLRVTEELYATMQKLDTALYEVCCKEESPDTDPDAEEKQDQTEESTTEEAD